MRRAERDALLAIKLFKEPMIPWTWFDSEEDQHEANLKTFVEEVDLLDVDDHSEESEGEA